MNNIINSSGIYDVNSYNLTTNNATVLSSLNIGGYIIGSGSGLTNLIYDNIINKPDLATTANLNNLSTNSTLNISNLQATSTSLLNKTNFSNILVSNASTINSSLYINTNQTTTISALSVNSTSASILVNIVQNLGWNDGVNYALNVSGYSMFGGVQINGQDTNNIYKRVGDLTIASPSTSSIILKSNHGNWESMRLNSAGISINTSLYISGITIINNTTTCTSSFNVSGSTALNNLTCNSSLNVSGTSNIGPLFINNFTGLQNTFLQIGTTGNILNITSNYSKYGVSEDPNETNILMFKNAGIYYSSNYNTSGNTLHLFGDSTSNNYLKLQPLLNTSYNPLIVQGNATINSNLNILENIYAKNLPNVSRFNIIITQSVLLNSSTFYKYDLDLRLYTTFVNPVPFILQRKFKFTCCLLSGALDLGLYNLNYDIDYNSVNYPSTGPQASLAQYNGINVLAYGFPYSNTKFNQIMPNGLFILKTDFNYITIVSKNQVNLLCIIINYLS